MKRESTNSFARLVERWFEGDEDASRELVLSVNEDLYRLAHVYIRRFERETGKNLEADELVDEVYLRILRKSPHLQNRSHFLSYSALIMRNLIAKYSRQQLFIQHYYLFIQHYYLERTLDYTRDEKSQTLIVALHEALERLEKLDARSAKIIELRYFGGLTIEETAQAMAVSPATVKRDWHEGKAWLTRELGGGYSPAEGPLIFVEPSPIFVQSPSLFADLPYFGKELTDDEFFELCQENRDLKIERTQEGELIIMPPTGGKAGRRNAKLISRFGVWAERDGSGQSFDSSTGFILPNRAVRSPDLSWLRNDRWNALSHAQQEKFPPLCPDFIVEIRSPSDSLLTLQEKMEEYISNGAQLGWLIDPIERRVHIYKTGSAPEVFDNPKTVSGDPLLQGFVLNVRELWDT